MADAKLTALGSATPISTDIIYFVDDPGGTPLSKKSTFANAAAAFGVGVFPDITDTAGVQVDISVPLFVEATLDGGSSGTTRAGLYEMEAGAGVSVAYIFPLEVHATISGGTSTAEVAGVSSIIQQTSGVSAVLEGFGTVMTVSGGTTEEVRAYNAGIVISSDVDGPVKGSSWGITQSAGDVTTDMTPAIALVTQSAGTTTSRVIGFHRELSIAGSNGYVMGGLTTINVSNGTNQHSRGAEILMNFSGGTNSDVIGLNVEVNGASLAGAAYGLIVKGPEAGTDVNVAVFYSRKATSAGPYIVGHASQSADLFTVYTSAFANLFKVTAAGATVQASSASVVGLTSSAAVTITSASATAFESGPNGGTDPTLRLVQNVASAATGLSITSNASGSGVTLTALGGSAEGIYLVPKGTTTVGQVRVYGGDAAVLNLYTTAGNAAARNWGFAASQIAYGDLAIKQSNIKDGEPAGAGTVALYFSAAMNLNIGTGKIFGFGGLTSSFPGLKNSSAVLQARLADDSDYATFHAKTYSVDGTAGATGGTFTAITSITVKNGIVTAITGT